MRTRPPGPAPLPTKLKLLHGNPGKRPINRSEANPDGVPRCPGWMPPEGRKEWRRMSQKLVKLGLLTSIDHALFEVYCFAYTQYVKHAKIVDEKGSMYIPDVLEEGPAGEEMRRRKKVRRVEVNPAVWIANRAYDQLHRLAAEFGMSPSIRTRIKINRDEGNPPSVDEMFD